MASDTMKQKLPTTTYELLTPVTSTRASFGRVFVYVLLTAPDQTKELAPYFVDVTHQLAKRFANHALIHTHWNLKNQPPKVAVLGTVEVENATAAVKDLTRIIKNLGYTLSLDEQRLPENIFTIPDTWYKKWGIKTGKTIKAKNVISLPENPVPHPTREQLISFFQQSPKPDRILYLHFVENYNQHSGKIYLPATDLLLQELPNTKKGNKYFIYPPYLPKTGVVTLPLQKSFTQKLAENENNRY